MGCGESGRAAADDDDLSRLGGRIVTGLRFWPFALAAHRDHPIALLDVPARYWAKRRRPEGLSRAQIETGVVPGATHRVANHETLGERPLIMGTLGTDCEHLPAAAHQQNLLVARMTDEHSAIGELIESDALGKVWTGELLFFLHHRDLPSRSRIASLRYPSASINHAQEFLPRQRIVTEAAQHSARDQVCVGLMHAASGHAVMRCL